MGITFYPVIVKYLGMNASVDIHRIFRIWRNFLLNKSKLYHLVQKSTRQKPLRKSGSLIFAGGMSLIKSSKIAFCEVKF